ncbi:MAG: hypothetical protein DRP78_03745 [Candidatus Omnitrophota bacterium]|nr:MAG: hypothetical protein DRP78_03745 [Candidatus Omnitrophota bacterium]
MQAKRVVFKMIAAFLIQAFLIMDFAWSGGVDVLQDVTQNRNSSLAPEICFTGEDLQKAFFALNSQIKADVGYFEQLQEAGITPSKVQNNPHNDISFMQKIRQKILRVFNYNLQKNNSQAEFGSVVIKLLASVIYKFFKRHFKADKFLWLFGVLSG